MSTLATAPSSSRPLLPAPARLYRRLAAAGVFLALLVIVVGAFTRLSDAGLGCPDWPGCYGRLVVPQTPEHLAAAEAAYPHAPVDPAKAWIEMGHRYIASGLGLLILVMAAIAWWARSARLPRATTTVLLGLVVFQGLLGMWTVTLLLKPLVVTAHLMGGMTTLGLLFWLWLSQRPSPVQSATPGLRGLALLALVAVAVQIFLGGWVSTNYAALACTEFPACHGGELVPEADFAEGFVLWRGLGQNYEYGVLDHPARTAIQLVHRGGAVVVSLILGVFGALLLRRGGAQGRAGVLLLGALAAQLSLGVAIVLLQLPLPLATAHNGMAALLLLASLHTVHLLWRAPDEALRAEPAPRQPGPGRTVAA